MMANGEHQSDPAARCCEAIGHELSRQLPNESIFFGPALKDRGDPEVARLRARGAHFYWVALPVGGVAFWDAHVGIVVDPADATGTLGVHRSRSSAEATRLFAELLPLFRGKNLKHVISEPTDEEQWNAAPCDLSTAPAVAQACQDLAVLLASVRRRLAAGGT